MPDLNVTLILPSGGARNAEIPDDVSVRDLLSELTALLQLPTVGPDGRPMAYRIDSKALGRELKEDETLAEANIPENDRLMITADITAGGHVGGGNAPYAPLARRPRVDAGTGRSQRSDFLQSLGNASRICLRNATSLPLSARASLASTGRVIPNMATIIRWRFICTTSIRIAGPG